MLKLLKKNKPVKIKSIWGLKDFESDANWIRVEKSVASRFKRDQVVQVKNRANGECIYVPLRGAGPHHSGMYRSTVALSYDNKARLGATKDSKGLELEIKAASWIGIVKHNLSSQNSEHSAVYQISLVTLIVTLAMGFLSLI
jgi:hypothetical protein